MSRYLMNLSKSKDTGNWKRKHWIAICGEVVLEEAVELS
jgi:hypothetical protein